MVFSESLFAALKNTFSSLFAYRFYAIVADSSEGFARGDAAFTASPLLFPKDRPSLRANR
ncbi:hypothetical protein CLDAP_29220 [Caldilinea aerophila DSM 14535 = NBRC 104270]|uniref:Uncharacterized protein n=1 Tax=Caldilinea aerophila (strain DSM 14535 / JCM 11387 / NBRC 104270 / STL-6-O1) TaxID=926550 RepID=I0I6S4_CALAS|nr:hypothetical protein CLDAP_29220 [Caldilinea aerophila DSM 14535 = NBRC 104270]